MDQEISSTGKRQFEEGGLCFAIGFLSFSYSVLVFRHWNRATDQSSFFLVLSAAFFLSAVGALFVVSRRSKSSLAGVVILSSILALLTFLKSPPQWNFGFSDLVPLTFFTGTLLSLGYANAAAFTLNIPRAAALMFITIGSIAGSLSLALLEAFTLIDVVRIFGGITLGIALWVLPHRKAFGLVSLPLVGLFLWLCPLTDFEPFPEYKAERVYSNSLSLVKVVKLDAGIGSGALLQNSQEDFRRVGYENINVYSLVRNSSESTLLYDLGDEKALATLAQTMNFRLINIVPSGSHVAIVGPGGGAEIQAALLAGAEAVTAIEINPLMVQAVRDFSRRPDLNYDSPKVRTVINDAAHYFRHLDDEEKFDLIMMSGVRYFGSSAPRVFNEDHVNTKEAFAAMMRSLRPGGLLVHRAGGQGPGFRNLIAATLKAAGQPFPEAQIYMGYYRDKNSAELRGGRSGFLTVFKPTKFSAVELAHLEAAAFGTSRSKVIGMSDPTPALTGPIASEVQPFALWISKGSGNLASMPIQWSVMALLVVLIALAAGGIAGEGSLRLISYAFFSGFLFMGAELYFFWWGDLISGQPALSAFVVAFALLTATAVGNGWAVSRKSLSLSQVLAGSALWLGITWPLSRHITDHVESAIPALALYIFVVAVFGFFSGLAFGRFVSHPDFESPRKMKIAIACNGFGGLLGAVGLKLVSLFYGFPVVYAALLVVVLALWFFATERSKKQSFSFSNLW